MTQLIASRSIPPLLAKAGYFTAIMSWKCDSNFILNTRDELFMRKVISDHGRCHIRGKQFLYDGGIRIPMIMRRPDKVKPGQVSDNLVMSNDIYATILEPAGVKPPVPVHGSSLYSHRIKTRKYIFATCDKMDETHDAMRVIRSKDHKLINL